MFTLFPLTNMVLFDAKVYKEPQDASQLLFPGGSVPTTGFIAPLFVNRRVGTKRTSPFAREDTEGRIKNLSARISRNS